MLTAAILTFVFAGFAAVISNVFEYVAVIVLSNVAAFLAVGWITLALRRGAHVFEPALGAGGAVLVFGVIQLALVPAFRQQLGLSAAVTSLIVSVGSASSLALLGALLTSGGRARRAEASAPRSRRFEPPRAADHGFDGPESQPAPHSG